MTTASVVTSAVRVLVVIAAAYTVIVLLAWHFQERIAFPGQPGRLIPPPAAGLADGEIVHVPTADGLMLQGWYLPPAPPAPAGMAPGLLWFYGNMESVSALAPIIRDLRPPGAGLLILDYRGYGESQGAPTEHGLERDAEAAWEYLASKPEIDAARMAVYGRSLGSAPALHLATSRPARALVLDSPFTTAAAMARRHYPFLPRGIVRLSLDNLSRARRLEAPLLVLHGAADRVTPPEMGRAIAEAGRAREFALIDGAGHNDTYDIGGAAYRRKFHAFLASTLR